jgi:hypothetical protein
LHFTGRGETGFAGSIGSSFAGWGVLGFAGRGETGFALSKLAAVDPALLIAHNLDSLSAWQEELDLTLLPLL